MNFSVFPRVRYRGYYKAMELQAAATEMALAAGLDAVAAAVEVSELTLVCGAVSPQ